MGPRDCLDSYSLDDLEKKKRWIRVDGSIFFLALLFAGTIGLSYGLSFRSNIYGAKYLLESLSFSTYSWPLSLLA